MRYFPTMILIEFLILNIFTFQCILTLTIRNYAKPHENVLNVSVLSHFVEQYVKPYIQSFQLAPSNLTFKTIQETPIEKAIRENIAQLKLNLQDYDDNLITDKDNQLKLDGNGETTIIEFIPDIKNTKSITRNRVEKKSAAFKTDIEKYKKVREKIIRSLDKVTVSDKTKKLVAKTLDDLIAQLIGSQCTWKSVDHPERTFRIGKGEVESIIKAHNMSMEEWELFKLQYHKLTKDERVRNSLLFFNQLEDLFSRLIDDAKTISNRYKLKCELIEVKEFKNNSEREIILREGQEEERKKEGYLRNVNMSDCAKFILCSDELQAFVIDFYNALNDTAVSVFRNYAAMYARDVPTEGSFEKETVVSVIKNTSNIIENKVSKLFIKEIAKIELDRNKNKLENMNMLVKYINNTIGRVKKYIKKHMESYLKPLRARLILNIKKDIDVNLVVDLKNLEKYFVNRICNVFVTCNGRVSGRRITDSSFSWGNAQTDPKSAYVKIKFTLDEDLKNELAINNNSFLGKSQRKRIESKAPEYVRFTVTERYMNINVTRTIKYLTNLTTKSYKERDNFPQTKTLKPTPNYFKEDRKANNFI